MCNLKDFQKISICQAHMQGVTQELDTWHQFYLNGQKVQLDIGAGCGETAFFYLNHGAEKVICVEGNKDCLSNLRKNFESDQRVQIIPYFIENIKIDIDGGERGMILEAHFPHRLRTLKQLNNYTKLMLLEEYWGSPPRKMLRKIARKLN